MTMDDLTRLESHIDSRLDSLTELLSEIKTATNDNTKSIIELQVKNSNLQAEVCEFKSREEAQHKEFYKRITDAELQTERIKSRLWTIGVGIPIILTAIGIILQAVNK